MDYSTRLIYIALSSPTRQVSQISVRGATAVVDELHSLFLERAMFSYARIVGIEAPWSAYNPRTGMQMTRVATLIEVAAERAGLQVILVHPSTWRSAILGKRKAATKKAEFKHLALDWANTHGLSTTDHNCAEAFCIAHYIEATYGRRKDK